MDHVATLATASERLKKIDKSRRTWTGREEDVLIKALKEVISKGWKSDNGFRPGYLTYVENAMHLAIPGTTLRGSPHINSKIHVWKKTYSSLVTILSRSGVGWNDVEKTIETTDEMWVALVKTDPTFKSLRHKQWIYYNDWCEIFGNDRAIGDHAKNFDNALQDVLNLDTDLSDQQFVGHSRQNITVDAEEEAISETPTPCSKINNGATSRSKKRKKSADSFEFIASAINNLADITQNTMSHLLKELTAEEKISKVQDKVLCALKGIPSLTEDEQVAAAKLLFRNHDDLALFYRLDCSGKLVLVKKLLNGESVYEFS